MSYVTAPETPLEQFKKAEGEYPLPGSITSYPVTSSNPTSKDALADLGAAMKILGGNSVEYPLPKLVMLISVISPLNMVAAAVAPVPPIGSPNPSFLSSTIYTDGASL